MNDTAFLRTLQLADSFFPTGMVTLSHGLEAFVDEGLVSTSEDFSALLSDYLRHQLGPTDAVALANAHEAAERSDIVTVVEVDHALISMKLAKEAREGSVKTGRRLLATARRLSSSKVVDQLADAADAGETPGNYAIAWGAVAAALGIPRREAMLAELHAFSVALLAAAIRMGRLTYLQAQDVLKDASEAIAEVVEESIERSLGEMRSFAPMIDLMAMHHQRAERRLFVS